MMITPEMMEQLGGKRGTPRGPDMTRREISAGADALDDGFAGAESLDDAVGDWNDGRSKTRRKKTAGKLRKFRRDKAYDDFAAANDRLDSMVAHLRSYVAGLRQFCDCHSMLSDSLVDGLSNFGSVADDITAYHAASQQWCRTSKVPHVDSSLHSKVEVALEFAAIDPIVAHIEVRRSLQAQLATAAGENRKMLLQEVELLAQSMGQVMKGPMRALRRAQADLLGTAAAIARREDECDQASNAQPGPTRAADHVDSSQSATKRVQDCANVWQDSLLAAWPSEIQKDPCLQWPTEPQQVFSPTATDCSRDACLVIRGQFGWDHGKRVLQISLRNESTILVTGITLTVLPCDNASILVTTAPLVLPRLQPREGASALVHLGLAEDADPGLVPPQSPNITENADEFDSFCTERLERSHAFTPRSDSRPFTVGRQDSASSEPRRSTASWALDAASCSAHTVRFALLCRELLQPELIEVQLPYHLLLHGHYSMAYDEFEHQWNLVASLAGKRRQTGEQTFRADDTHAMAARGYATSLARRRAYSGTTRVCVRIEGHGPMVGWARFEDETLLSEVRASLLCNPAFHAKLPADWVFVKKNAPINKRAEGKWTVRDLGSEIILRSKVKPASPAQARISNGMTDSVQSRRTFEISTQLDASDLVQALARGGIMLVARVEQRQHSAAATEGLLRFGARAGFVDSEGEQVFFLLQMERQIYLESEPEPEQEPVASQGRQRPQYEWCCSLQASQAELEPVFENCIRSLACGKSDFLEFVELVGGGTAYYGDWAGVTLGDAQAGAGNDDRHGYVYHEYGGVSREQVLADFFESEGEDKAKLLAKAAVGALKSAGVPEHEWMRKLTVMRRDGELDAFLKTAETKDHAVVQQQDAARAHNSSRQQASQDYGDYGGVSLEDASGKVERNDYDYGDYGGVSLEEAAAFTSSEDDTEDCTIEPRFVQTAASPTAAQLESMDREAAAMIARMEATNTEVSLLIHDDMRRLILSNPNASLADWAARSEWARDTGGARDEEGSPVRAQEGAWRQLWAAAAEQASSVIGGTEPSVSALNPDADSTPQLSARSSLKSSSAAWLAQRHMNAMARGTSAGSTVRIAVGRRASTYNCLLFC